MSDDKEIVDRATLRAYESVKNRISDASASRLIMREMVFARLVAEEGFTLTDAYKEAYQPQTENKDSIYQMASRIAAKPRVFGEIERIKRELKESELKREARLALALDGRRVKERMAVELYAGATSDADLKTRLKCWELLGSMTHVDAFVRSGAAGDDAKAPGNQFGISANQNSSQARSTLMETTKRLLGARAAQKIIDVPATEKEICLETTNGGSPSEV